MGSTGFRTSVQGLGEGSTPDFGDGGGTDGTPVMEEDGSVSKRVGELVG